MSSVTHNNITIHGLGSASPAGPSANKKAKPSSQPVRIVNDDGDKSKPKSGLNFSLDLFSKTKVQLTTLHTFANQLSVLLKSGMPLVGSLKMLGQQSENKHFADVIANIAQEVQSGLTLTEAFAKFPRIFPTIFIAMLRAAELGGNIADVLEQLAKYLLHQESVAKKVKSATAYPKFVLGFFSVVVTAIIFGLVPKFKETFSSFGAELPRPTQIMMDLSDFLKHYLFLELLLIAAAVIGFKYYKKTTAGKFQVDSLVLRLPVVGEIVLKSIISQFCRTLGTLIRSGVSIIEALDIAGTTTSNVVFQNAFAEIKQGLLRGETITMGLVKLSIFPSLVINMVSTGEQSGSLEIMLNNVSDIFDTEIDSRITSLTSILEPALMVALGAVALVVILVLYLPIFYLGSVM